jgi:putative hydrolase of the HAD superfamily
MVLVFDLDDTLYEELTFVKSGFNAVAVYLCREFNLPQRMVYNKLVEKLNGGRGAIFDDVLKGYGILSKKLVRKCVSVYRLHQPKIKLFPDAVACLARFKKYPLYIVTDGNKLVQENKIKALAVDTTVKKSFITHRFGVKHAKPSAYAFEKICQLENVKPSEVVYIADNPAKDFVGIKPLGFKTIRLMRGNYKSHRPGGKFEADVEIHSLNELTEKLIANLGN